MHGELCSVKPWKTAMYQSCVVQVIMKVKEGTPIVDRCRINILALATVALSQVLPCLPACLHVVCPSVLMSICLSALPTFCLSRLSQHSPVRADWVPKQQMGARADTHFCILDWHVYLTTPSHAVVMATLQGVVCSCSFQGPVWLDQ